MLVVDDLFLCRMLSLFILFLFFKIKSYILQKDWYQVFKTGSTVIRLDLSLNGLSGSLPTQLGYFTALTQFKVDHQTITG
jgi:hypothetical protein